VILAVLSKDWPLIPKRALTGVFGNNNYLDNIGKFCDKNIFLGN